MDANDTVRHRHHSTLVADVAAGSQALDAALDQFRNFGGIELHHSFLLLWLAETSSRDSRSEGRFHLFKTRLDRSVEHFIPNHHTDTTDQTAVNLNGQIQLSAKSLVKHRTQFGQCNVVDGEGADD